MTGQASGSNGYDPAGWDEVARRVLDPDVLQRMANEFYRDVPGESEAWQAADAAVDALADPSIFSTFLPLAESEPALSYAREAVATAEALATDPAYGQAFQASNSAVEAAGQAWGSRGIRGGLSAGVFSPDAAFGWLAQARSLFDAPGWTALSNPPGSEALPGLADRFLDLTSPQVWGAIVPSAEAAANLLPGFLGEIRAPAPGRDDSAARSAGSSTAARQAGVPAAFDVAAVRRDFPILQERVNGRPLVWLDNAATTQKPRAVIDRLSYFYAHENSNIHRAAHTLAARATDAYEASRETVRRFINAASAEEIVFVRGATEAINLVAQSWGRHNIGEGDEILITWLEHHANIVPWQMLAAEKGARLRVAPVDDSGQVILSEYQRLVGPRTKLVAITQVSNALGTITPAQEMAAIAHRAGATVLIDGAQAVSHMPVDVQALGADFYVFSGHKVFGPTGIGVVYGRSDVLAATPPWQGGGNMIADVTFEATRYQAPPTRFEAGTGNIADAVGLASALDYVTSIGMANIARYEHDLLHYATEGLLRIPGLRLIGTAPDKAGVLSFVLEGFRTADIGAALSAEGVAVRASHHCAQPILRRFGVESTVRPSLALYNDCSDVDALVAALWNLKHGRSFGPY